MKRQGKKKAKQNGQGKEKGDEQILGHQINSSHRQRAKPHGQISIKHALTQNSLSLLLSP